MFVRGRPEDPHHTQVAVRALIHAGYAPHEAGRAFVRYRTHMREATAGWPVILFAGFLVGALPGVVFLLTGAPPAAGLLCAGGMGLAVIERWRWRRALVHRQFTIQSPDQNYLLHQGLLWVALLVVLAAVMGPSLTTTILVIGVTGWARFARVVRADVMSLKATDFVTAARAVGVRDWRIIWRHLLPNVMGPIIVLATLGIGGIIILESALSFLGLGIRPPEPSWGRTLADGRDSILRFPHISFFPGLMIVITVLAFNVLGDGLRDALDPREQD